MKKISSFILAIAMIISMAFVMNLSPITAHATEASVWDGTTITQPTSMKTIDGVYYYEISTAEELAYIAKTGGDWLGYNYILANDITLNSVELTYDVNGNLTANASTLNQWTPINGFSGIFDGGGFRISGVYVNSTTMSGLFASSSNTIKNLTVDNSYIKGGDNVGGISGRMENDATLVENCVFSGCVIGSNNVGGIVGKGYAAGKCVNYGLIIGEGHVGGIIGDGYTRCSNDGYQYFNECQNYGNIFGKVVGGIVGKATATADECCVECINYGTITGEIVGGICGRTDAMGFNKVRFLNCSNYGNVYSSDKGGGICGVSAGFNNCSNYGDVLGENGAGGIVAQYHSNDSSVIHNCINTGNINTTNYGGGLCGIKESTLYTPKISNCYNTGNVSGSEYIGGIFGYNEYFDMNDCINTGNTVGSNNVGAISGYSGSIWGKGTASGCVYMKTETINATLKGFGNADDVAGVVDAKNASFFCLNSDKTLNKNGHTYSSTVPCDATCDTCGYERTVTHTYDNVKYDSDKHWYECDCGEKKADSEASHTGGTATCTNKAKCDVCKQSYGDLNANNHTTATGWTNANDQHYHMCSNGCDAKLDIANCADTDKNHKCDVCSADMGPHEAANGKHTCDYCGKTVSECTDSTEDDDSKCDICYKDLGTVHTHTFVEGKCACGETDPNHKPETDDPEEPNDRLGTGAITGIVVGSVAVVGGGGFALFWFVLKKKTWLDLLMLFKK